MIGTPEVSCLGGVERVVGNWLRKVEVGGERHGVRGSQGLGRQGVSYPVVRATLFCFPARRLWFARILLLYRVL